MKPILEFKDGMLWQFEDDGKLVIGVTQEALDTAGAVQALDLADAGDEFEEGDWIGEVRGKNALVEITAPCALRVVEGNPDLLEQPALIEDDPTGDAWVLRVEKI